MTPTAAGTDTYTLTCANTAGSSTATSVALTVTAAAASATASATSTGHGGGGRSGRSGAPGSRRYRPRTNSSFAAARATLTAWNARQLERSRFDGAGLAARRGLASVFWHSRARNSRRPRLYTAPEPRRYFGGEDQTVETVYEDTLYDLASKFSLGSEELIRRQSERRPWLPGCR